MRRWILRLLIPPKAAIFLGASVAAQPLRRGEILVTDWVYDRVVRLDPATGATSVFSPPPGGENLLVDPHGIVHDVDRGVVFVTNFSAEGLVAIDPSTGVQSLAASTAGFHLEGLALSDFDHGGASGRALYAAGRLGPWNAILVFDGPPGAMTQTEIGLSSTFSWRSIDIDDAPSGPRDLHGGAQDCDVPLGAPCEYGLGRFDFSSGTQSLAVADGSVITGIDVAKTPSGIGVPFFTACDDTRNGLYVAFLGIAPVSEGGDIDCPDSLTASFEGARLRAFVGVGCMGAWECSTARVVEVRQFGSSYVQTNTWPLVDDVTIGGMTRVPEADGALVALLTLALGAAAHARCRARARAARRRSACTRPAPRAA